MKKLLNKFSPKKGFIQHQLRRSGAGFTLIELLIVVAIIAALAIAVFVALNPAKRLEDANNARRAADADTIVSAIHTYVVDKKGIFPTGFPVKPTPMPLTLIGSDTTGCDITLGTCTSAVVSCYDVASNVAAYLKSNPIDPKGAPTYSDGKTGYAISVDANSIVTIKACGAQGGVDISVSR